MAADLTLDGLLAQRLATDPDSAWLVDEDRTLSAAQADEMIAVRAAALTKDSPPTSRLVVSMANHVDAALTLFAAVRGGMTWVGIHPRTAPDKLAELTRRVNEPADPSIDALAVIAFTSGTSGTAKGVMHTQHNVCLPAVVGAARLDQPPVIGMYLSLMSINMQILGPIQALVSGGSCVCLDTTDSAAVAEAVERYAITSLPMAAATAYDWVAGAATADQLRTLAHPVVGGSGLAESLIDGYTRTFGHRLTVGYGLTEAPTSVSREPLDRPRVPGSAGVPLDHLRVTIRDVAGERVAVGLAGEICIEAADDRYRPMLGYWRDPQATADALRIGADGRTRLHTGDRGSLDADGFLHVLGRGDEVIVRGGVNVSAEEVETLLRSAPGVLDAALIGLDDVRLGQVPVALIVSDGRAHTTELLQWCATHLAAPQRPVDVVEVPALERSPMGKLRRRSLRAALRVALEHRAIEAVDVGPAEHRADHGDTENDG